MASLIVFNNIASELSYQNVAKNCSYRSPTNENIVAITSNQCVTKIIEELLVSWELKIYIVDGVRKKKKLEQNPTMLF